MIARFSFSLAFIVRYLTRRYIGEYDPLLGEQLVVRPFKIRRGYQHKVSAVMKRRASE